MKTQISVDACISAIYEGVTNEESWLEMLKLLADSTSSKSGFFCLERHNQSQILSYFHTGFDSKAIENYATHFIDKDIWTKQMYRVPNNSFIASHDHVAQREFYRSEIFNDWANEQDMHYATGIVLSNIGDATLRLSLQRDKAAGGYTENDLHVLNRFTPHLKRAVTLRNSFADTAFLNRSVSAIVESLPFAAMLLDSMDKIVYFNAAADSLFARGNGFANAMGTLRVDSTWSQQFFGSVYACLNCMETEQAQATYVHLLHSPAKRATYEVSVAPLIVHEAQFCFGYARNLVLVVVKEQTAPEKPDSLILGELFGLTAREALIASLLCQGKDIKQIAQSTHTSILTVRTHVKAILRKTESGNQQQLIAKILNGVAALSRSGTP